MALRLWRRMVLQTTMLLAGDSAITVKSVLAAIVRVLTPFWFFDKVDKEAFVLSIPIGLRGRSCGSCSTRRCCGRCCSTD